MIGQTISHYRIIEKLGEGGMGVVYKAHDNKLDRTVALKFLPSHLTATDKDKQRFIREAKAAAALNHPNICTIHHIDEYDGKQFIVMEYINGVTLRDTVGAFHETPLRVNQAITFALQIAEALAEAHEKSIVHRDIKPENIMVDSKNRVKVMDFGLAKVKDSVRLTKTATTVGTIAYMSPEQIQGAEIDHRSDIFSFGVLVYEMIVGRMPFRGEHEAAMMYSIVHEEPQPLSNFIPNISPDLIHIIERMLEKDKNERYQSINDVVTELQRLKKKTSTQISTHPPSDSSANKIDEIETRDRHSKRKGHNIIVASSVVLIMIVIAFYYFLSRTSQYVSDILPERISIAVLPFENLSPDPDNEYFTDGVTEDIIIQLSKIGNLRVMSRSSMMRYKGSEKPIREIGDELGVNTILEGSVRRVGNRVRINSQLIDLQTNESLWGETYDRTIEDIFSIQSDVATQIAYALQINLSAEERSYIERQPTKNLEAYDYYLRGREYYSRYRREHNESAIEFFKRAIDVDPEFALAYAGLADAYGQRVLRFNYETEWLDSAITAGNTAIRLDPTAAEGYKALGLVYIASGKFKKAIEENLKAVKLNPNHDIAHLNTGISFLVQGDFENAAEWIGHSSRLRSPTDPWPFYGFGLIFLYLDDLERAKEYFQQSLFYTPDFDSPRITLALCMLLSGQFPDAYKEAEFLYNLDPYNATFNNLLAFIQILDGKYDDALINYKKTNTPYSGIIGFGTMKFLSPGSAYIYLKKGDRANFETHIQKRILEARKVIDSGNEHFIYPYQLATSYAMLGEKEKTYEYLEHAVASGWRHYRYAMIDPSFESVRHEPRFDQILDRVKSIVEREKNRITIEGKN